jgi:hypothetical protein
MSLIIPTLGLLAAFAYIGGSLFFMRRKELRHREEVRKNQQSH